MMPCRKFSLMWEWCSFLQTPHTPAASVQAPMPQKLPPLAVCRQLFSAQKNKNVKKARMKVSMYYHCYSLKNLLKLPRKERKDTTTNQFLQPESWGQVVSRLTPEAFWRREGELGEGGGKGRINEKISPERFNVDYVGLTQMLEYKLYLLIKWKYIILIHILPFFLHIAEILCSLCCFYPWTFQKLPFWPH